jgi:hypothetical protein
VTERGGASGAARAGDAPAVVARRRARGQWLHAPGGDVVRHLLAVQAQDARSLPRALSARGGGFRDGLRIIWLMRTTLHLVDVEDLAWLHPLFAPRMVTANERRLRQLGVTDPDAAVEAIVRALPATRAELAEATGLAKQALVHAIHRAAIAGRVSMTVDRTYVALSLPPAPDRDPSLDELARRYYACHAGATERDLAYWSGLPLRDCRPPTSTALDDGPVPDVLIPAFDELLLGWRDRTPTVRPEHAKRVHPGGGILRAVVLEDGVAVGTWSRAGGRVSVERF